MSMVKNLDISTLSRALFSELILYDTREVTFICIQWQEKVTMVVMT